MSGSAESTELGKEKGQEILDLKVREMSLVDKPAILREFLVVKRQQEENMGAFEPEPQTDDSNVGSDVVVEKMNWQQFKEEEVEKALPIDLRNAIGKVMPWLKKQAGVEGAPKNEINRVVAFLGKVAGGKYPYPSPTSKAKEGDGSMADEKEKEKAEDKKDETEKQDKCPKCGAEMKDGVCTKCGYKQAAGAAKPEKEEEGEKKKGKGKVEEAETSKGLNITVSPDGQVQISGQPLAKGQSQFTGERTTALKGSVAQLLNMLAQVDKEAAKSIIDELAKGALPADVKWTSGTTATPASVKKAIDEALAPVVQENTELKKRLEDIEKSRSAPKSEEGDGDKEPGEKVKKSENVWSGLPLW